MDRRRSFISYFFDLLYGVRKYPFGCLRPFVVRGYFNKDLIGQNQKLFFDELLKLGFRRTYWQLVFPLQTAGLVKRISPTPDGIDEYHIRFYSDGVIDCELEVNRFDRWHWAGPRRHGMDLLHSILDNDISGFESGLKENIRGQFGVKGYSGVCVRS